MMDRVTISGMQKMNYIKELNDIIKANVVDGKLTDESIRKMVGDIDGGMTMFARYGFCYSDVSNIDLSEISYHVFNYIPFSTYTKFPEKVKLPKYFNPEKIFSYAMKNCYRFKVDDKKCNIAIIDNPTQFYIHEQFEDVKYEIIKFGENDEIHFHAEGVLSNITSKDFGYGQGAKYLLYSNYWNENVGRMESHLKALQDVYKRIKNGEKIPVVSISSILIEKRFEDTECVRQIREMVEILKNNPYCRCEVVDSMKFYYSGFQPIYVNSLDEICKDNYKYSYNSERTPLGVPINKIEPLFSTTNGYRVASNSDSVSWAIPIVSYFYAVCRQYGDLSFDDYVKVCKNNLIENNNGVQIVDFESVVEKFKNKEILKEFQ